jgi:hypothetical protein
MSDDRQCPKCRSTSGWSGPTYLPYHDALEWSCRVCKYSRHTTTYDAPPQQPKHKKVWWWPWS